MHENGLDTQAIRAELTDPLLSLMSEEASRHSAHFLHLIAQLNEINSRLRRIEGMVGLPTRPYTDPMPPTAVRITLPQLDPAPRTKRESGRSRTPGKRTPKAYLDNPLAPSGKRWRCPVCHHVKHVRVGKRADSQGRRQLRCTACAHAWRSRRSHPRSVPALPRGKRTPTEKS